MEAHVDVEARADCSLISPGDCTMPRGALTFLLLGNIPGYLRGSIPTDSSQVSSTSGLGEPPYCGMKMLLLVDVLGEGEPPSTGSQTTRWPRGHHEEAMLCPVLSPTLLPIKCDPRDVGSALPGTADRRA